MKKYICLFIPLSMEPPEDIDKFMTEMNALTKRMTEEGILLDSGPVGMRSETGLRVTQKVGQLNYEEAPKGPSTLMEAGGFAVMQARDLAHHKQNIADFLAVIGDSTVESIEILDMNELPNK